jgi:hypothetical protein
MSDVVIVVEHATTIKVVPNRLYAACYHPIVGGSKQQPKLTNAFEKLERV